MAKAKFIYQFDLDVLEQLIADELVVKRKHPILGLWIYNYSAVCQYRQAWGPYTMAARGLILDEEGLLVSRPFPKFFNVEEHPRSDILWKKPHTIHEKMDGSLGILYPSNYPQNTEWAIASRGSFESQQAHRGTALLQETLAQTGWKDWQPHPEYTYMFEIIYPENRIVVDYGDEEKLVFLAAVHRETGANAWDLGPHYNWPGEHAPVYEFEDVNPRDYGETFAQENKEGFVLYFPHANTRVKVKFEDYKRLHKLVFGLSTKSIWESLMKKERLGDMLERIPDEFNDWARKQIAEFTTQYHDLMSRGTEHFKKIETQINREFGSCYKFRGEFATLANTNKQLAPIAFMLLDENHDALWEYCWKQIKPKQAEFFYEPPTEEE